jgi:hypothetical protein
MIIWNIFSEALNYYSQVDGFGASFASCLGSDLLYVVFFTIAAYFQRWKIKGQSDMEAKHEHNNNTTYTEPLIPSQYVQVNVAQVSLNSQSNPPIVEEKIAATIPI